MTEQRLKENIEFFARLTQKTLSDFHATNSDDALTNEMDTLRQLLNNRRYRKVEYVEESTNTNKVILHFTDKGPTKEIDVTEINVPVEIDDDEKEEENDYTHVRRLLHNFDELDPVTRMRLTRKIQTFQAPRKIQSYPERIFFMSE